MDKKLQDKYEYLIEYLKQKKNLVVAFSGGVDSTFLLKAAQKALGENVVAVTINCESFPERELMWAEQFCHKENIQCRTIFVEQMSIEGFSQNPPDRCYLCKKALFQTIQKAAKELGILQIAEGTNLDDDKDFRPGMRAIKELGILSPLKEAGLSKQEIRELSKEMGIANWNKPALACLATRFVQGERITVQKLKMVEAAEQFLSELGFSQMRVRIHGNDLARIEVMPEDFKMLLENREAITKHFIKIGFRYVSMDLNGYRMGSMNKKINKSFI